MAVVYNVKGTSVSQFQIGKQGPLIKNNSGIFEFKNSTDSAFVNITSLGIDDNASSTAIEIDSSQNISLGSTSGSESLKIVPAASAVNRVEITGSSTGNDAKIAVAGSDTNINLALEAKGTGTILFNSPTELVMGSYATGADTLSGTSVTPDLTVGNIFTWSITGNSTLNNPTIPGPGVWYVYATVDATGGYTLSFGNNYNTISGSFDGSANTVNILSIVSDGTELDVWINQRP